MDLNARKQLFDRVCESMAAQIQQFGEEAVHEGDVISTVVRSCVLDCTECRFSVFNKQTKSSIFTPSHVCPGHASTRVNCCGQNFQGWRDKEIPERNVLNHLLGIKNGHSVRPCAQLASVTLDSDESIRLRFLDESICRVLLDRIDSADYRTLLTERAKEFSKDCASEANRSVRSAQGKEILPKSVLRTPDAPRDQSTAFAMTRSSLARCVTRPMPIHHSPCYPDHNNVERLPTSYLLKQSTRIMHSEENESPCNAAPLAKHDGLEGIPRDWPFLKAWEKNHQECVEAKRRLDQAEEMKEMLEAALHVFNKKRIKSSLQ